MLHTIKHSISSTYLSSSLASLLLLGSQALALDIILVTDNGGNLQTFLENEGHTLTVGVFATIPDEDTIAANDLIIFARETNSGTYTADAISWNQFPIPLINMAPHTMRNNRWAWASTSILPVVTEVTGFDAFPDPDHPFLMNLSAPETEIFFAPINTFNIDTTLPATTTSIANYGSDNGIFIIPEGTEMFNNLGTTTADRVGFIRGNENSWDFANPNAETILRNMISFFDPIVESDLDADGLDDNFEQAIIDADPTDEFNTLADVLPGDDFDRDSLTNQQEHDRAPSTDPTNADTDGDGSDDGEEDANNTNPLNPDTDNDGLLDGVESNSGTFVDSSDTGTDPLNENTDSDDFRDGAEVNLHGSDPTDFNSIPSITARTLFIGASVTAPVAGGGDFLIIRLLEDKFGISQFTYQQGSLSESGDEEGFDLIVISSTNNSGDVRGKFNTSTIPVINWEQLLNDASPGNFGLSDNIIVAPAVPGVTSINLLAEHPITAGLTSPLTLYPGNIQESYYSTSLGTGVISIATGADGPALDNPMFMIAEEGAQLALGSGAPGDLAPARRVYFPFDDNSWGDLSDDAFSLVNNSIDWAIGNEAVLVEQGFEITNITYNNTSDPGNAIIELTFNTRLGETYDILTSLDLLAPINEELTTNIIGTGNPLTVSINANDFGINDPKRFFFIREN